MVGEWRNFIYILFLLLGCIVSLYWQRQWCWSGIQWNVLWFLVLCLLSMLIHQVPLKSSLVSYHTNLEISISSSEKHYECTSRLRQLCFPLQVDWGGSASWGSHPSHGISRLARTCCFLVMNNGEPASIWPHVKSLLTALWCEQVTWPKRMAGVGKLTQSCVDVNCEVTWQRAWRQGRVKSWDQ